MTTAHKPETVFTLTIDAQDVTVRYQPNHIDGPEPYAIIEFTNPHEERRRIPLSKTGYRSFFAPMREIEHAPSVERYASLVALVLVQEVSLSSSRSDKASETTMP
jgi:hypothetical protein